MDKIETVTYARDDIGFDGEHPTSGGLFLGLEVPFLLLSLDDPSLLGGTSVLCGSSQRSHLGVDDSQALRFDSDANNRVADLELSNSTPPISVVPPVWTRVDDAPDNPRSDGDVFPQRFPPLKAPGGEYEIRCPEWSRLLHGIRNNGYFVWTCRR